jgi:hypothetical protein
LNVTASWNRETLDVDRRDLIRRGAALAALGLSAAACSSGGGGGNGGGWGRSARKDPDANPPGPKGGPGTNWENPPGPKGGPGKSPDRGGY